MREEEEPNWFARWEEQLPSPDELMPLSQTLITPDLALAFDICTSTSAIAPADNRLSSSPLTPPAGSFLRAGGGGGYGHPQSSSIPNASASASDFEPSDLNSASAATAGGAVSGGDELARTLKRPRLVWTPQLHKRFVDAVAHLGIKNAVPKTIMQLMSVDGLTRENVASHLQKYRLYLKRMLGLGGAGGAAAGSVDAATDQLFASGPVPHHFLSQGPVSGPGGSPEPLLPFGPVAAALQHQQQHMTAALQQQQHMTAALQQQHHQQQFYNQRHLGRHFDSQTCSGGGVGTFEHGFVIMGMPQPRVHRIMGTTPGMGLVQPPLPSPSAASYVDDLECASRGAGGGGAGERTVLALFPSGED